MEIEMSHLIVPNSENTLYLNPGVESCDLSTIPYLLACPIFVIDTLRNFETLLFPNSLSAISSVLKQNVQNGELLIFS
jgi:hypothetical protein